MCSVDLVTIVTDADLGTQAIQAPTCHGANVFYLHINPDMKIIKEALLGGSMLPAPFDILRHYPCSFPFFGARSFLPVFTAPFSIIFAPCSFFIFPLAP